MADAQDSNSPFGPLTGGLPPNTGKSKKKASDFDIPQVVKDKYGDLVTLILETESMNDEEREYWFQILPIMTEEQVGKFRAILENEKEQLARLDAEYQQEIKKLNNAQGGTYTPVETKEAKQKRMKKEQQEIAEDEAAADKLLEKLDDL